MAASSRALLVSHLVVFAAGVAVGKGMDADELNAYRSAHESTFDKIRRKAGHITMGLAVVVTLALTVKAARSV